MSLVVEAEEKSTVHSTLHEQTHTKYMYTPQIYNFWIQDHSASATLKLTLVSCLDIQMFHSIVLGWDSYWMMVQHYCGASNQKNCLHAQHFHVDHQIA